MIIVLHCFAINKKIIYIFFLKFFFSEVRLKYFKKTKVISPMLQHIKEPYNDSKWDEG